MRRRSLSRSTRREGCSGSVSGGSASPCSAINSTSISQRCSHRSRALVPGAARRTGAGGEWLARGATGPATPRGVLFRYGGTLRSVHPDAFGVLRRGDEAWPFFLEWERRALHPSTMVARLAP